VQVFVSSPTGKQQELPQPHPGFIDTDGTKQKFTSLEEHFRLSITVRVSCK